jgi:hypothetical protein
MWKTFSAQKTSPEVSIITINVTTGKPFSQPHRFVIWARRARCEE